MIWLSIFPIALAGYCRFLEGDNKANRPWQIENVPLLVIIGLCAALVAFINGVPIVWALVTGVNAAACIGMGCTKWESLQWQTLRGSVFGLWLVWLLSQFYSTLEQPWLIIALYLAAYIQYTAGYHLAIYLRGKFDYVLTWEKWMRITQASFITSAGLFI